MSLRAHAIAGVAALALCLASASASAHELEMNTARVTMRDGNVVIHAEVDVVAWLDSLGEDPSQRDPSRPFALSSVDPAQLAERSAQARRELTRDLRVEIDGERLNLRLREFPSDEAIVRAAARDLVARQIDDHAHPQRWRIVVDAVDPVDTRGQPKTLSVTMPKSLGEVLVNFVQPQTQLAPAGTARQFSVLQAGRAPEPARAPCPPVATTTPTPDTTPSMSELLGLLGAFAAGILFGTLAWRRKRKTP